MIPTRQFESYQPLLKKYKASLVELCDQAAIQRRPVIIVLEGWSASGKDKIVKCLTERLNPDRYACHSITEPQGEEAVHHFLWRYWLQLPPAGKTAIFMGSWYRRVLYERVTGSCTKRTLKRAFREINQFERQNINFGTILVKFWLHISYSEHTNRVNTQKDADDSTEAKDKWHDYSNRKLYEQAANEMLIKTSSSDAAWTIVPADSEIYACLHVLQTVAYSLSRQLNFFPSLDTLRLSGAKLE